MGGLNHVICFVCLAWWLLAACSLGATVPWSVHEITTARKMSASRPSSGTCFSTTRLLTVAGSGCELAVGDSLISLGVFPLPRRLWLLVLTGCWALVRSLTHLAKAKMRKALVFIQQPWWHGSFQDCRPTFVEDSTLIKSMMGFLERAIVMT